MARINHRTGTIDLEIEQNPEDSEMWAVWETDPYNPDNDEIVASFPTREAAQKWIDDKIQNWKEYLKERGISNNG